jgi:hypothetical protein
LTAHHINAVSLVPYAYVNLEDASVNYNNERQWWGERTEGIIASNQMAHDHKMTVMLKPHLWANHGFYTGDLDFSSDAEWKKWESNYSIFLILPN